MGGENNNNKFKKYIFYQCHYYYYLTYYISPQQHNIIAKTINNGEAFFSGFLAHCSVPVLCEGGGAKSRATWIWPDWDPKTKREIYWYCSEITVSVEKKERIGRQTWRRYRHSHVSVMKLRSCLGHQITQGRHWSHHRSFNHNKATVNKRTSDALWVDGHVILMNMRHHHLLHGMKSSSCFNLHLHITYCGLYV